MKNTAFMRLLKSRTDENGKRMSVKKLAARAGIGRSHLTQVLHGQRRGPQTRLKVLPYMTTAEGLALGWEAHHYRSSTWNNVPGK